MFYFLIQYTFFTNLLICLPKTLPLAITCFWVFTPLPPCTSLSVHSLSTTSTTTLDDDPCSPADHDGAIGASRRPFKLKKNTISNIEGCQKCQNPPSHSHAKTVGCAHPAMQPYTHLGSHGFHTGNPQPYGNIYPAENIKITLYIVADLTNGTEVAATMLLCHFINKVKDEFVLK